MLTGIVLHMAVAAGAGTLGYTHGIKKGNREFALLCAGAQPSIAIAMSLFDLGITFADMESAMSSGGIFKAMSLKMFHMVGGIAAGLAQEALTQWVMPAAAEEKKSADMVRSAVAESVSTQIGSLNKHIERVERVISEVPSEVSTINQRMINEHRDQSEKNQKAYDATLSKYSQSVAQVIRQTHDEFEESIVQIHEITTSSTSKMKKDLEDATVEFGDTIKQETQKIATLAANQGSQVILGVAQQVANTLQATTATSLQAAANLAKTTHEAQQAAQTLNTNRYSA
jgi:hypothetical protein